MNAGTRTDRTSVMFVTPSLQGGGAERVVLTLLRHLDRQQFAPVLVVLDGSIPGLQHDVPSDVEMIDLAASRVRYALPRLFRLIRQRRPDVVFSIIGHLNLAIALLRPFLPRRTRLVARETNVVGAMLDAQQQGALWRLAYRRLYRRFDAVICQSAEMRRELIEDFALPAARAQLIRNPLDVARIRTMAQEPLPADSWPAESIRLVAAGRLSHEKGVDILLEALAMLNNRRLQLLILGEGPLRAALEAQARSLGVAGQVRFAGFDANPYRYFAHANALVLSSRFESFPNVVLEALACGTTVVATPARGGIGEIAPGQPGCFIAREISPAALAESIQAHLDRGSIAPSAPALDRYDAPLVMGQYAALLAGRSP